MMLEKAESEIQRLRDDSDKTLENFKNEEKRLMKAHEIQLSQVQSS